MCFSFYSGKELERIPLLWKVKIINEEFKHSLEYIKKGCKEYDLSIPEEALKGKMIVGNKIVKQLFTDPLLPEQFLPNDWCGNELRKSFFEWDKLTTEKSRPYWEQIFTNY